MPLSEEWWADPNTSVLDVMIEYSNELKKMHVLTKQYEDFRDSIESLIEPFDPESYVRIWVDGLKYSFIERDAHREMMAKLSDIYICPHRDADGEVRWVGSCESCNDTVLNNELQNLLVKEVTRWRQLALPAPCDRLIQLENLISKWVNLTGITLPDAYGEGNEKELDEWIKSRVTSSPRTP